MKELTERINTNYFKLRLEELLCLKDRLESAVYNSPAGSLRCLKRGGGFQYYVDGHYVKKENINIPLSIAQRDYYREIIICVKQEIEALKEFLDTNYEDKIKTINDNITPGRRALLASSLIEEDRLIEDWINQPYDRWEISDEEISYPTNRGERVRSKSEKIIADELNAYNVPYKYEVPLQLNDRGRLVTIRPDFLCLNKSTRKEVYIEHFGMMDDFEYSIKFLKKWDLYERNGYIVGDNVLFLHESKLNPLNIDALRGYIERNLL